MVVRMGMLDGVRMRRAVVRMSNYVLVLMRVFFYQGIKHYDYRSQNHDGKTDKIRPRRFFFENDKG